MIRATGIILFKNNPLLKVFGIKRQARSHWRKRYRKNVIHSLTSGWMTSHKNNRLNICRRGTQASRTMAIFIYNKNYKR